MSCENNKGRGTGLTRAAEHSVRQETRSIDAAAGWSESIAAVTARPQSLLASEIPFLQPQFFQRTSPPVDSKDRSHARCREIERTIDVLITDLIMPGLRGTALAHQVEELRPGVQVIYISGYAQNLPEARVAGGAAFLQKPFRLASLGEQLKLVSRKE
jgi:CheY-like chemotaxis protein